MQAIFLNVDFISRWLRIIFFLCRLAPFLSHSDLASFPGERCHLIRETNV